MDAFDKLRDLGDYMGFEPAEETRMPVADLDRGGCGSNEVSLGSCPLPVQGPLPIYRATLPGGGKIPLLKTMLTSVCERDCYYCCFRTGRDFRRTTFNVDELSKAYLQLYQVGQVQGLFLSSGVAGGGVRTQDRLIAVAEILRLKMQYTGYLHLKIMPGAEYAQVERTMQLADRVSINLEGPNSQRLASLAPHKTFADELVQPLRWVEQIRREQPAYRGWNGRWPSSTTQFVVGGVGETDLELLSTTATLNQQVHITRAYFSRFSPVEATPLENQPACNPWRQARLYQASFLLRDYGFMVEEMPYDLNGNLPLNEDPKLAWARENLIQAPIEVNRAGREQLLRIPGIGPRGVQAILKARGTGHIRDLNALRSLGISPARASAYILLDGKRPPQQLKLF